MCSYGWIKCDLEVNACVFTAQQRILYICVFGVAGIVSRIYLLMRDDKA